MKSTTTTLKMERQSFMVIIGPRPNKQKCVYTSKRTEQGITWERPESKIKTKQQRLLPYFCVTHGFNCLFLLRVSAYVNYTLCCFRRIRVKKYFSVQAQTPPQHTHTHIYPHLLAPSLTHWRKLNICLFSSSLLQNLASFSNFSFFLFFLVRSGIPLLQLNSIYCTFIFFWGGGGAQFVSYRRLGAQGGRG